MAKFKDGHEKKGGRQAGTPNKNRDTLFEELNIKYPDFNPLVALVEIAEKTKSDAIKVTCYKELAKYHVPQLKSISIAGNASEETIIRGLYEVDEGNIVETPRYNT